MRFAQLSGGGGGYHTLTAALSLVFAVAVVPSVFARVEYRWASTAGGDLAESTNWESGAAPGSSTEYEQIYIEKDQSKPITLSKDISVKSDTSNANYASRLSFNGEMKFDTAETTLTLNRSYWRGNNKVFSFTRGILELSDMYFENGNNSIANNKWTIDGPEATLKGSLCISVTSPNNLVVVTNGAAAYLTWLTVGRNAGTYNNGLAATNNIFRVAGVGSKLTASSGISTGVRENNRIEILDGATAVVDRDIKLGEYMHDIDVANPNLFDHASTVLVSGKGSKLTVNPTDGFIRNKSRIILGFSSSSNTLEVANGAELVCYSNKIHIAYNLATTEGNSKYLPSVIIKNVPDYRFRGNRLRVTGEGSKMSFISTSGGDIMVAYDNVYTEDNRIEILDGGSFESVGCGFGIGVGLNNGVYVGERATFKHDGNAIYVGSGEVSTNCFFTVEGGTCITKNGFIIGNLAWGAHLDALAGAKVTIGDDTNDTVLLGGKTDEDACLNAAFNIAGAGTVVTVSGTLNVNKDSTLSFDVPQEGFTATPLTVNHIVFGTKCATPPTLRVTQAERNKVRYVTLVESANAITVPDTLTLDLPAEAKLLKAGDAKYDAKKLIVRLKTEAGFAVIIR